MKLGFLVAVALLLLAQSFKLCQTKQHREHRLQYGPNGQSKPTVEFCGDRNTDLIRVSYLSLSPDPARRGHALNITGKGYFKKPIEKGAYMDVQVKLQFIKFLDTRFDLCEVLPNVNLTCPVSTGVHRIEKLVDLPSQIPMGKYTVNAKLYTNENELLTCVIGNLLIAD